MQRGALQRVQRALVGVAVFLQTALEQDHQGGLAAGGRAEQQQQATADVGAGARRLEVVDDAVQGGIDAVQLALEQAGRRGVGLVPGSLRRYQRSMSQMY